MEFRPPAQSNVRREDYEFDYGVQQRIVEINGYQFPVIGRLASQWNSFWPTSPLRSSEGLLTQSGHLTIINPDEHATIAFIHIRSSQQFFFQNEEFSKDDLDEVLPSRFQLIAFPRQSHKLTTDDEVIFESLFASELANDFENNANYIAHRKFIRDKLTPLEPSPWGVRITDIQGREKPLNMRAPIQELLESPDLSSDDRIRDAFSVLLGHSTRQFGLKTFEPFRPSLSLLGLPNSCG